MQAENPNQVQPTEKVSMVTAIVSFIVTLPGLVDILAKIWGFINDRLADIWNKNRQSAIEQLESAQTPQQKQDAARDIANVIGSIR